MNFLFKGYGMKDKFELLTLASIMMVAMSVYNISNATTQINDIVQHEQTSDIINESSERKQKTAMDDFIATFETHFNTQHPVPKELIKEGKYEEMFSLLLAIGNSGSLKAVLSTDIIPLDVILNTIKEGKIITKFPAPELYEQDSQIEKYIDEYEKVKKLPFTSVSTLQRYYIEKKMQEWREQHKQKSNQFDSLQEKEEINQLIETLKQKGLNEQLFTLLLILDRLDEAKPLIEESKISLDTILKLFKSNRIFSEFPSIEAYPENSQLKKVQLMQEVGSFVWINNSVFSYIEKYMKYLEDQSCLQSVKEIQEIDLKKAKEVQIINDDVLYVIKNIAQAKDMHELFLTKQISEKDFLQMQALLSESNEKLDALTKSYEFNKAQHMNEITEPVFKIIEEVESPIDLAILLHKKTLSEEQ